MLFSSVHLAGEGAPTLDCYVLDSAIATGRKKSRPAILICPGGGYLKTSTREGEVVAARFLGMGYDAFVLCYHTYVMEPPQRVGEPPVCDPLSHYPLQVVDLMRAMAYVRSHAGEWGIEEERIYALGFSAGGHVVGSLAERWDDAELLGMAGATADEVRPRGVLLCYPMVNGRLVREVPVIAGMPAATSAMLLSRALFGGDDPSNVDYDRVDLGLHLRPDMPRMFVWQTAEDELLHAEDTVSFAAGAMAMGVSCELHVFQRGRHGMSLCDRTSSSKDADVDAAAARWVGLAQTWLELDE